MRRIRFATAPTRSWLRGGSVNVGEIAEISKYELRPVRWHAQSLVLVSLPDRSAVQAIKVGLCARNRAPATEKVPKNRVAILRVGVCVRHQGRPL